MFDCQVALSLNLADILNSITRGEIKNDLAGLFIRLGRVALAREWPLRLTASSETSARQTLHISQSELKVEGDSIQDVCRVLILMERPLWKNQRRPT